jgi:hypothetical protein
MADVTPNDTTEAEAAELLESAGGEADGLSDAGAA